MKTMLLFIFIGMFGAALAGELDKRQVLKLSEHQRGLVLGEMRALLSGTQNILAALSKDDMAAVAHQARALGMSMAQKSKTISKARCLRRSCSLACPRTRISIASPRTRRP